MPWAHCTGRGSSWRWMEKNMNQWSILKKNHSGRLVIPLFLALSFLRCSMPRGELWEILRSYQPFTSCRTNDRVNGIRERENIPPNSRIVAIWQLRWPECHVLHFESDRDNVNGSTRAELLGSYWPRTATSPLRCSSANDGGSFLPKECWSTFFPNNLRHNELAIPDHL